VQERFAENHVVYDIMWGKKWFNACLTHYKDILLQIVRKVM